MTARPGITERDIALDQLEATNQRRELVQRVRRQLIALYELRSRGMSPFVTGDDAVTILRNLHYAGDRRIVGAIFRPGSGWRRVTAVPSLDKTCHGRVKTAWAWVGK